jgi:hypothetical protein
VEGKVGLGRRSKIVILRFWVLSTSLVWVGEERRRFAKERPEGPAPIIAMEGVNPISRLGDSSPNPSIEMEKKGSGRYFAPGEEKVLKLCNSDFEDRIFNPLQRKVDRAMILFQFQNIFCRQKGMRRNR